MAFVLLVWGCNPAAGPVEVAEHLSQADSTLSQRLAPRAEGGWVREAQGATSPGWRAVRKEAVGAVGSLLPATADGTWQVGLGQSPGWMLRLDPVGARPADVEVDQGRAVYREAYADTDVVWVAEEGFVEQVLLLRSAQAPVEFSWTVTLPVGLPTVRQRDGGVVFEDRQGQARLRVPQPFAVDAQGVRRDAVVRWADGRLVVRVDTTGLQFPVLLDPVVEVPAWTKAPVNEPRERSAMATLGSKVVLFGGYAGGGVLRDTWGWDGTTWTLETPAASPPARCGHALSTLGTKVVLFGGAGESGALNDTWEWDGTTWTQKKPAVSPPARADHALATVGTKVVLFGGGVGASWLNDTWEWDGTTWTQKTPAVSPSARESHALSTLGTTAVLFGGYVGPSGYVNDTWEWDGTTWTQKTPAMSPPARYAHSLTTLGTKVVLFGGTNTSFTRINDTWEWDGTTWSQKAPAVSPPSRNFHALATLGTNAVLFGGNANLGGLNDTWAWDGTTWTQKTPAVSPPARYAHSLTTLGTKAVLFGGRRASNAALNDTWEWDGSTWTQKTPAVSPPARSDHALATLGTKVVLFGGTVGAGYLNDTWEWDGTTWTQKTPAVSPSARTNHALATLGTRVVLFGGRGAAGYLNDTWEWDGTTWTQKVLAVPPPVHAYHALATRGAKVVLFGGSGGSGTLLNDTWEWDGTAWTDTTPAVAPPARTSHALATLGTRVVLFGGSGRSGNVSDTWEWDGTAWTDTTPAVSPPTRATHALATLGTKVVLFGGYQFPSSLGDTWAYEWLRGAGSDCGSPLECLSGFCVRGVCSATPNSAPVLAGIGDKTGAEGATVSFALRATDPEGDSLTYAASNLPTGATLVGQTFSWTPTFDQAGSYPNVRFMVSDGELSAFEDITITVSNVNRAPSLTVIGNQSVAEGSTLTFTVAGTDPDQGATLTYAAANLPPGATFMDQTFSWSPAFDQAGSFPNVRFTVSDGELSAFEDITITVSNVSRAPSLTAIGNQSVAEGSTLTFTVAGTDPDDGATLTYSASNLPSGATFNAQTFSWTPAYDQAGSYPNVRFSVSDGELSAFEDITITVSNVNRVPSLTALGNQSVAEGSTLTFTVAGTDPDQGATLTYSASNLPPGATLVGQTFSWTPAYDQAGNYPNVRFTVSDGELSASEDIAITVSNVNRVPSLTAIGNQSVAEGSTLSFTVAGMDPDDGATLTYSAANLPSGATFNGQSFSWTPAYDQAGSYPNVRFTVSDGELSAFEDITITVGATNRAPSALAQTVTLPEDGAADLELRGTDADQDTVTFTVVSQPAHGQLQGTAPALHYVPEADFHGDDALEFVVSDGITTSAPARVTFHVTSVNDAPVALPQTLDVPGTLDITLAATDVDGDGLAFRVVEAPQHGTLAGTAPALSYRATECFTGEDSFTFSASDGALESSMARITLHVSVVDGGTCTQDAGVRDGGGGADASAGLEDAGAADAAVPDAGRDADCGNPADSGAVDAAVPDAGGNADSGNPSDAGAADATVPDANGVGQDAGHAVDAASGAADAAATAADAGTADDGAGAQATGGCGCDLTGVDPAPAAWIAGVLALLRRRRTTGRPRRGG